MSINAEPGRSRRRELTNPLKPENFHQYLRAEIRHATRAVMEEIMREELSHLSSSSMGRKYHRTQRLSQRVLQP